MSVGVRNPVSRRSTYRNNNRTSNNSDNEEAQDKVGRALDLIEEAKKILEEDKQ